MTLRSKLAVSLLVLATSCASPKSVPTPASTFTNPLLPGGADPWMSYVNGEYYLSVTNDRDIRLRHAATLAGLKDAKEQVIWTDTAPGRDRHFWAPEFHRLGNGTGTFRWYCYYTASGVEEPSHRMFVLESASDDIRGPYQFKAKLKTDPEDRYYAIDGTTFEAGKGERFFAWCGRPSETGQGLFLSRMSNPWTLEGPRIVLKADGFGCEFVREGPEVLKRDGKIYLVYSMCSADTADYRLGMLVAEEHADLMNPASWKQHPKVVFARNDAAGVYGPGHNFFFKSPDRTQDWIVYHAKPSTRPSYGDRSPRAQPFTWNADGTPEFGVPVAEGAPVEVPRGE